MATALRMQTTPRHSTQHDRPKSYLRPSVDWPANLDFDTTQRFGLAVSLLDRLLTNTSGMVKLLDVGCNILNLLPQYFDADRVRITRCDTFENISYDPYYIQIVPGEPLPFANESFDAVVSLEVLE